MYFVVKFPEENTVEGVPLSWVGRDDQGKLFAYWPSTPGAKQAAKNCMPVNKLWTKHYCEMICKAECYDSMDRRAERARSTSDVELSSVDKSPINKRKKTNYRYSSDEEDCLGSHKAKKLKVAVVQQSSSDEEADSMDFAVPTPPRRLKTAVPPTKKSVSSSSADFLQGTLQVLSPVRSILQEVNEKVYNPRSLPSSSHANQSGIALLHSLVDRVDSLAQQNLVDKQQHDVALTTIVKQCENHSLELKMVKKTMNKLEQKLDVVVPPANIKSQIPLLPVTSMDELDNLEKAIENPEQKELLTRRLSQLGGSKFSNMIHHMMRTLLDKRVGIKYSLLGKTDKKAFVELKSYTCIKDALRRTNVGKDSTDKEIGQIISLNLIGSRDRGSGRQDRQKKYDGAAAAAAAEGPSTNAAAAAAAEGPSTNDTNEDLTELDQRLNKD